MRGVLAWLGADLVLVPSYFYMMQELHRTGIKKSNRDKGERPNLSGCYGAGKRNYGRLLQGVGL